MEEIVNIFNKKNFLLVLTLFLILLFLVPNVFAVENSVATDNPVETGSNIKNVYFFWGLGCPHCEDVKDTGILEEVDALENVNVYQLEVYNVQENRELYFKYANLLETNSGGVPFLVVECKQGYSYFIGSTAIINNLKEAVTTCNPMKVISNEVSSEDPNAQTITLGAIIIAALIDSINPCAFGVLIFLLATLTSMASSKRALRFGLIYVAVIFIVYFLAGLGLMAIISEYSAIMNYVIMIAAGLVFVGGIIEIKDFFWYGKGVSLKIPVSVKPALERMTQKGTLGAVILLGAIVALVELPCTGGIYLAILSLMHVNKTFGISYLVLYNFIFVLPLIIMVFAAYFGTKTEKLSGLVEGNKKWMRLFAGIIMILLALYLLNTIFKWM